MVKEKEITMFSCEIKQEILNQFNSNKFPTKKLMDKVYWHPNLNDRVKQYALYQILTKHHKDFKTDRERNFYGLRWDWFNCGYHLYKCDHIIKSDYITNSTHIDYSSYVNRCSNCDHLLFCNNLSNKSYMAFNQPVEPKRFRELKAMSLTELKKQPEFNKSLYKMLRSIHKILKKGESHNEIHNG